MPRRAAHSRSISFLQALCHVFCALGRPLCTCAAGNSGNFLIRSRSIPSSPSPNSHTHKHTMQALVRHVASSFAQAATMAPSSSAAISVAVARQQHGVYVQLLQSLLGEGNVTQLPADDKQPGSWDCTAERLHWTPFFKRQGAETSRRPRTHAAASPLVQTAASSRTPQLWWAGQPS